MGKNKNKFMFWDQIYQIYLDLIKEFTEKNKYMKGFKPFPVFTKKPLEDQWYHIQHHVSKYCGYYSQVQQRMRSGSNCNDLLIQCQKYSVKHISQLHLQGVFQISGNFSKIKCEATSDPPSSADPLINDRADLTMTTDSLVHQEGQKLAKKGKRNKISIGDLIKGQKDLLEISHQNQKSLMK